MPVIHVYLMEGRSEAQKAALIAAITDAAVATVDTRADAVRVIITDTPKANYGIGGKSAKALGR